MLPEQTLAFAFAQKGINEELAQIERKIRTIPDRQRRKKAYRLLWKLCELLEIEPTIEKVRQ